MHSSDFSGRPGKFTRYLRHAVLPKPSAAPCAGFRTVFVYMMHERPVLLHGKRFFYASRFVSCTGGAPNKRKASRQRSVPPAPQRRAYRFHTMPRRRIPLRVTPLYGDRTIILLLRKHEKRAACSRIMGRAPSRCGNHTSLFAVPAPRRPHEKPLPVAAARPQLTAPAGCDAGCTGSRKAYRIPANRARPPSDAPCPPAPHEQKGRTARTNNGCARRKRKAGYRPLPLPRRNAIRLLPCGGYSLTEGRQSTRSISAPSALRRMSIC